MRCAFCFKQITGRLAYRRRADGDLGDGPYCMDCVRMFEFPDAEIREPDLVQGAEQVLYQVRPESDVGAVRAKPRPASVEQPDPKPGGAIVLDRLMLDLQARADMGLRRYGTYLTTDNGRDALMDAYQEALDLAMYLAQALMERGR